MYKCVLVLVVFLMAMGVGCKKHRDKEGSQNIVEGTRTMDQQNKPIDTHLYHESIKADGSILSSHSQDVCFPHRKSKRAKFIITAFNVTSVGKKTGLARVNGGGVGKHKVCFHLKGERGKGFHFEVDIFGNYK